MQISAALARPVDGGWRVLGKVRTTLARSPGPTAARRKRGVEPAL